MAETSRKRARKSPTASAKNVANGTPLKMRDMQCEGVSYRFKVALEKFNLDALRSAVHVDEKVKRDFHVVNTLDSEIADYHAHFEWRVREKEKEITIEVQYVGNPVKSKPGEQEPFAENLMQWVGQFFKHGDVNARIHSDFEFEAKRTALSWFPLPWRTKIASLGCEAVLDGIAVALPAQPDLVSRFFLSHVKDSVFLGIESERRIKFAEFSLDKELQVERAFANKLIEVKS